MRPTQRLNQVVPPEHNPWETRGPWRFVPFARQLYGTYRRCVPLLGYAALRRLLAAGVPAFFHRPLEFLLTEELNPEEEKVVTAVEQVRAALISRGSEQVRYYTNPPRAESSQEVPPSVMVEERTANSISWRRIATISSVIPYWGTFLHLCAKAHGARTILELGSCAGISSCYLASSPSCEQFFTIEGSPYLASVATANLAQITDRATVLTASFDSALDELLPSLSTKLDCVFIDGHHEGSARLHYSQRVTPHMRPGSLMIWDDVQWSSDLWDAWQNFSRAQGVSCAINLGRFGLVIWDGVTSRGGYHDFSAFAGYWGKGKPRPGR